MKKAVLFITIMMLMANLVYSQESVNWNAKDSDSDEKFASNFEKDPAGGFNKNPDKAWATIEANPNLMTRPEVASAAFDNNRDKAANTLDKNPSLLIHTHVVERYNAEAINNINLLNENPQARDTLLAFKFKINNQGSSIYSYDGQYIGTGDPKRSMPVEKFIASDFPGATITRDGALIPSKGKEIHSGTAYRDKDGKIISERGFLVLDDYPFSGPRLIHYQNTVASQDEAFLFQHGPLGSVVVQFSKGSLTKEGDDFIVAPDTQVAKYVRDEQGNIVKFGVVTADNPIKLSQAFENCRLGTNCVTFNPVESRVRITESGAAVIGTSYNPAAQFEKPLQNGYKFDVPSSNGFRLSAANGETSVSQNGIISYSPTPNPSLSSNEMQQVGSIWQAVPETATLKDLASLPAAREEKPELEQVVNALRELSKPEAKIGDLSAKGNVKLDWLKILSGRSPLKSASGTFTYPIGYGSVEAKFELIRGTPGGAVTYSIKW